jgi:osmoprotectant transport system ATP-binding protein
MMISLNNVSKKYGDKCIVDDITFDLQRGEFLVLLGGSGSGKTTVLKMINRLIDFDHGKILFENRSIMDIPKITLRRKIGYCFQQLGLFPHMTVAENIGVTLKLMRWHRTDIEQRVNQLLDMVELDPTEYKHREIESLSGGQGQRVAVARALAANPDVVLFDEPFAALDPIVRKNLQASLLKLVKDLSMTCIFVTHDIGEAFYLADRIGVMFSGKMIQIDEKNRLLENPKNEYVSELIQSYVPS